MSVYVCGLYSPSYLRRRKSGIWRVGTQKAVGGAMQYSNSER